MSSAAKSTGKFENSDMGRTASWAATFMGVFLAIATIQFMSPGASNSHALAPYVSGFCSKYGVSRHPNNSVMSVPNEAHGADRLDAIEMKLDELALAIKTLAADSMGISSKLDSELAGTGRILEELAERLHRVENHVFVSEDLA